MKRCFEPKRWDIWLADVMFEDLDCSKIRPVLVIDGTDCFVLSLKMTSKGPRVECSGEYQVKQWKEAGLIRPTVIRISKRISLTPDSLRKKIGVLQDMDINGVKASYQTLYGIKLT